MVIYRKVVEYSLIPCYDGLLSNLKKKYFGHDCKNISKKNATINIV